MISLLQRLFPVLFGFSLLVPLERPAGKMVLRVVIPAEAVTCSCKASVTIEPVDGEISLSNPPAQPELVAQVTWEAMAPGNAACKTVTDPDSEQGPRCATKEGSHCTLVNTVGVTLFGSWAGLGNIYLKVTGVNTIPGSHPPVPQWFAFSSQSAVRNFTLNLKSDCKFEVTPDSEFLIHLSPSADDMDPNKKTFKVKLKCASCKKD
jgi:hypothetical protein